jgi:hypothetical protein
MNDEHSQNPDAQANPLEPPNAAAAAFKQRVEEGLWTTCFTDNESIWADWSDLTAEGKLQCLAEAMDWELVPEAYFLAMVGRELDVTALRPELQAALRKPLENRHVFSQEFESTSDDPPPVRDTTRNLVQAVFLDAWPRAGAIVDFGLDSQAHYEALYYGVREGEITPEALDAALGNGEKLTALARSSPSNPHHEITFSTSWDIVLGGTDPGEHPVQESGPDPDSDMVLRGKQAEALYAEWREDYAARAQELTGKASWQVWHLRGYPESRMAELVGFDKPVFPVDFIHVANVLAASSEEAVKLTTDTGDIFEGTLQSWKRNPGVLAHVFAPRDSDAGDVVVDPAGQPYRVERDGFLRMDTAAQPSLSPSEIADRPPQPKAERGNEEDFERRR